MARFQFLVYVIFVLINQVYGALNGDCSLVGVVQSHWDTSYTNVPVDDNHGDAFHTFTAENIISVTISTSSSLYAHYFRAELIENEVIVWPSDDFPNLETTENSDADFTGIFATLQFGCNTGTASLAFSQPINDLNTYIPTFTEPSYTYILPMPLPTDFNIGCLGSIIKVCDEDITNTRLNFAISPSEDFSVTWGGATDETNKCHLAVISTKTSVRLTEEKTYVITVTDVGNPTASSTASLTIQVDEETTLPLNPQFESASYTATYNADTESHSISLANPIQLEDGYKDISVSLSGVYGAKFEATIQSDQISVILIDNLPIEVLAEESFVSVTIEATLKNAEAPGRTVLIVQLPEKPPNPQFQSASYTATYNADGEAHTITVDGPISLVDGYSDIEVKLLGEERDNFEAAVGSDQITVTLKSNLPENALAEELSVLLTIEATSDNAESPSTTVLVVRLLKDPELVPTPQFESASYTATYTNDNDIHSITVDDTIRIISGYTGIDVALEGEHKDNFEAAVGSDQITVTLKSNLPENVLAEESSVLLTIQATLENAEAPGRTVLVVRLPKNSELPPTPQFESASYTATYTIDNDIHSITVDDTIRLISGYTGIDVALVGEHKDNFEAAVGSDQITVTLKSNLPENVLAEESSVLLTIVAILENAEIPGRTVLVVRLPKDPELPLTPQFESASYTATYIIDNDIHSINVEATIRLISGYTGIDVALIGEHKENFEAAVGSDQITVTLKSNLPENVLAEESSVLITIQATFKNAETPGRTVLVVRLPKYPELPPAPQFESASYTATYIIDNDIHSIKVDNTILLISGYTGIGVALVGEHKDNFEAAAGSDQITVTLKSNLPETVLEEQSSVLLTIEATLENAEAPGRTVLVVQLPKEPELPPTPKFESASYTATYNIDNDIHSIIVDDTIRLMGGYTGIDVALVGEHKDNFEARVGSDQITVTLKSNLPENVLSEESSVLLTIEATLENAEAPGRTVLVVRLPKDPELPPTPQFESASYTATYNIENDIHSMIVDDTIRLMGGYTGIDVALVGEHKDNFEARVGSDQITVTLKSNLPESVLSEESSVLLTIVATLENAEAPGRTVLVVRLPKDPELPPTPQFESASYTATYNIDNDIHSMIVDDTIRLMGGYTGIDVALVGEHKDNFEARVGSDQITVTLKSNLPESVLSEESSVLLTIVATLENAEAPGRTVLVVRLPKDPELPPTPQFESASYTATYNIDNDIHSMIVDDTIRLMGGYTGIDVALVGEHKDNFEARVGSDQITVTLKSNLPESVLSEESSVLLTIVATLENAEAPGRTVLVVRLPKDPELRPTPQFESASYTATYNIDNDIHSMIVDDTIRLMGGYTGIDVALVGEHKDNFEARVGSDQITVTLKSNLPENVLSEESSVLLTIVATLENAEAPGRTVLMVRLPKDPELPPTPQFESVSYTATYSIANGIHSISVDGEILLIGGYTGITVALLGEYNDNFEASIESNEITVTLKSNLPGNLLAEDSSVILTIEATLLEADVSGKTVLVIQLPKDPDLPAAPEFDSTSYTATYSIANGIHSISVDGEIRLIGGYAGITVALLGEYNDNFEASIESNEITVTLKSNLPGNVLAEDSSVILTIEATLSEADVSGKTVLVIQLPKDPELPAAPEFDSTSYTATYSIANGIHSISVDGEIRLIGGYAGITVALLGEYNDNFEASIESNEITVTLKSNLPGNVLAEDSSVIITIEATLSEADVSGKTVLVVQLPKDPELPAAPEFDSTSYTATYSIANGIHSISVDGEIRLIGGYTGITVALLGEYNDNFEASIESNEITVTLKSNLPGNVLAEDSSVILTIEATLSEADISGKTVLVIQLPKDPELPAAPEFDSTSYTATYSIANGIHSVSVDGEIRLIGGYTGITVALLGEYNDNFEASIESNGITVTLKSNLPGNVLAEDSSVIITIEASLSEADVSGKTVLVIQLPKDPELPAAPEFDSTSYTATYSIANGIHSISVDGEIRLIGGYTGITVALLGEYNDNFEATIESNEITVTLKSNLPGNVLAEDSSVILTIDATLSEADVSGKTVLVIQLPKDPELPAAPEFDYPSYTATYSIANGIHSVSVDGEIRLVSGYTGITVALLGEYNDNFEASIESNGITVTLKSNLPGNVLAEDSSVIITIEASLSEADVSGKTVLVIQLPKDPELPAAPEFDSTSYTATYSIANGIHSISVDGEIRLIGGYTGITVALLGEYNDNFEASIESNEITVTLKSNLPGNVLAEDSSVILTIDATLSEADVSGKTVLVIQLPKDPELPAAPEFDYPSYTATYSIANGIHSVSVDGEIRLVSGYTGITVALLGEYSENFEAYIESNEITITLKSNLPGNVLAEDSSVIITIEATLSEADVSGKTVLVVQLPKDPDLPSAPQFEFPSYTATYITDNEIHVISIEKAIHLNGAYSGISVDLSGEHSSNFAAVVGTNEITVTLKSNLPGNVLAEDSSVIITIEATLSSADVSGKTVLVVQLPKDPELLPAPQFESSSYTATYNAQGETHSISVNGAILLKEEYSGIQLTMLGEYKNHFDIGTEGNEVIVTLSSNLKQDVLARESSVLISIEATLANAQGSGLTVLVVQLPKDVDVSPNPQFESASYRATYSTDTEQHSISVEGTIRLEKGYADIKLELLGDYKDYFKAEIVSDQISVTVIKNLGSDVLTEGSNILITIEATLDNAAGPGRTVLVVELPEPPLTSEIKFESDNYDFKAMEKYEGFVGFVRATAISEEPIKYSLEAVGGSSIPSELKYDDNTGALKIEGELLTDEYSVIAVAKGTTSNAEARASVVLYIYENTGELYTTDSVIVKHVSEKQTEEIELPCAAEEGDCEYEIFEQYPETTSSLFEFRDGKLHCDSLDRQMDQVKDMPSPQYTVSLRLTKMGGRKIFGSRTLNYTSHQLSKRNADYIDGNREWVYIPKNVIKKPDQLLVSIIIEDINDNYPIFDNEKLVVGYPTKELAIQLAPPYLAKVQATDLDAGLNAEIKYTSSSTHFVVHPKTGVIYPTEGALDDDSNLKFTITAIDMDGDDDGLSTDLQIEVIPLEQNHLAILTVTNILLEDVDNKLQELSQETGMQMKYLTAAVIPNVNTYSKKTMPLLRDSSDHLTRIVVYALDSEDNPIETDTIQQELEEAGMLDDIAVDKWSPSSGGGNETDNCEEPSVAGFIAAVSVLASLLIIFIITVAALYYFKIYRARLPQSYDNMDEEDAGSITYEKSPKASTLGPSDKIAKRRPTEFVFSPPPIEEEEDNEFGKEKPKYENPVDFYINMKDEKNNLYDTPVNYSTDTGQRSKAEDKHIHFTDSTVSAPAYGPIDPYEEDEFGERKLKLGHSPTPELRDRAKSVSFKPTVEKINIVVDDKADDIFDERL